MKTTKVIAYLVQLGLRDLREVVVLVVVPHIVGELVHRPIVRVGLLPLQKLRQCMSLACTLLHTVRPHSQQGSTAGVGTPRAVLSSRGQQLPMHWTIASQRTAGNGQAAGAPSRTCSARR